MPDQEPASAQAEVSVDASPDNVYALVTDLRSLASLAEEARAMEWRKGDAAGQRRARAAPRSCRRRRRSATS